MVPSDSAGHPTDEAGSVPLSVELRSDVKEQPRSFLKSVRRELNEKELSGPAAVRFLVAEIERLDTEAESLRNLRDRFYQTNTELQVLREATKTSRWNELLSFVCLSVGAAGLGAAPSYISVSAFGWVFAILSAVLLMAGIAARVWK